jgi:hypothetical protein
MAHELTHPYAYDERLRDYLAPDDPRVRRNRPYKVGRQTVYLRVIRGKRPHFWDPTGGGGGGGIESMAHIFAKKFYKERMFFSATVAGQRFLIRFATCELEQRLSERTPDVSATVSECWPPFMRAGDRFLIEIHAQNAIHQNPGRREALERIGVPCVEIHLPLQAIDWKFDARRDPDDERARFEDYMRGMLATPFDVDWIVPNPPPRFAGSPETIALLQPRP